MTAAIAEQQHNTQDKKRFNTNSISLQSLPKARADHNALYACDGLRFQRGVDWCWYWQKVSAKKYQQSISLQAGDNVLHLNLHQDVVGLSTSLLDWRNYTGEGQLLAWTVMHEPLLEIIQHVMGRDCIPVSVAPDKAIDADENALGFRICSHDSLQVVTGEVVFPASWIKDVQQRFQQHAPEKVIRQKKYSTVLHCSIDEFDVDVSDLKDICLGSVIRLDNSSIINKTVNLLVGIEGYRWPATLEGLTVTLQGKHSLKKARLSSPQPLTSDHAMTEELSLSKPILDTKNETFSRLPVALRFDIGTLTLPYNELQKLQAGYTFELNKSLEDSPIILYANDVPMAKGELVNIGELLGVRIADFLTDS